ncbi:isoprenyl transferase [Clostridia bacterium]|nr:isoprenyl transferase [Clostridia bacterium]
MSINVRHIAIVMDGNRRWAQNRGMSIEQGHKEGMKTFQKVIDWCSEAGLGYLTTYVFSTENWSRSKAEVDFLISMIVENFSKYREEALKKDVRVRVLGTKERLSDELKSAVRAIQEDTKKCTGLNLNLAFNYGGRLEIVEAAKAISVKVLLREISIDEIDEDLLASHMYTKGIPDPELIIRTGGEQRVSNFLTWQSIYSEFVFLDVLWPDFKPEEHLKFALSEFEGRNRRYGGG